MGIPMLQFAIDLLREAGVKKIVANIHHLPKQMREGFEKLDLRGVSLQISDESGHLLGGAGGIKKAAAQFDRNEPFFLMNTEPLCAIDLKALADWHFKMGKLLTLAILPKSEEDSEETYTEIAIDYKTYQITGLGPKTREQPFYSGIAVMDPKVLDKIPEDVPSHIVQEIFTPMIAARQAGAYLYDKFFVNIGTPRDWQKAHFALVEAMEKGTLPKVWAERINSVSEKLAPGVWIRKGCACESP